jgi:hypothetical protein
VIEIGRCAHGREGGVRATLDELRAHVPLPHLDHGLLWDVRSISFGFMSKTFSIVLRRSETASQKRRAPEPKQPSPISSALPEWPLPA